MEDTAIIDLYWLRSEDAIRETAAKYGAYCRSIARGLLANAQDEEECVSDTWIRAWNAMPDERPNRLKLFLGKITRRLACDVLRSRTAQKRGGGVYVETLEELGECVPSVPGADKWRTGSWRRSWTGSSAPCRSGTAAYSCGGTGTGRLWRKRRGGMG